MRLLPFVLTSSLTATGIVFLREIVLETWISPSTGYRMTLVDPAWVAMGSPDDEPGRLADEAQRRVRVTRGFWIGVAEVTQAEWTVIMRTNPSKHRADDLPVDSVTWCDAVAFANRLSVRDKLEPVYDLTAGCREVQADWTATGYRLPTEAEWELAARAGAGASWAGGREPDAVAWTAENAGDEPHPPCGKAPNALGLCDMSGNVAEHVWDRPSADDADVVDPRGGDLGWNRRWKGGSWLHKRRFARVAARAKGPAGDADDALGLRLARSR